MFRPDRPPSPPASSNSAKDNRITRLQKIQQKRSTSSLRKDSASLLSSKKCKRITSDHQEHPENTKFETPIPFVRTPLGDISNTTDNQGAPSSRTNDATKENRLIRMTKLREKPKCRSTTKEVAVQLSKTWALLSQRFISLFYA